MAWSDAARAAALEVRRRHSHAMQQHPDIKSSKNFNHVKRFIGAEYRQGLAGILSDARKHGFTNSADYKVPKLAVQSTRLRNQVRLAGKY